MRPRKTPTSSLSSSHFPFFSSLGLTVLSTALELLIMQIRYRGQALLHRLRSGRASSKTPPTCPSPATRLPLEVVEVIIAYLVHDLPSLRACSLTCYSWYIAAAPRLHHPLVINTWTYSYVSPLQWPEPIRRMHSLGLLPLVGSLEIKGYYGVVISSKLFRHQTLRQFMALTNVQELTITYLDIPSFIPQIRQYFGHFFPTVRSLKLGLPKGSNRQILFFIGSFRYLENLWLFGNELPSWGSGRGDDLTLVPPFTPPLQGQLTAWSWGRANFFRDMVRLFGGIRFTEMRVFNAVETQFLLRACAKTLHTLQCVPTDPRGGYLYLGYLCGFLIILQPSPRSETSISGRTRLFGVSKSRRRPLVPLHRMATVRSSLSMCYRPSDLLSSCGSKSSMGPPPSTA